MPKVKLIANTKNATRLCLSSKPHVIEFELSLQWLSVSIVLQKTPTDFIFTELELQTVKNN